MQRTFVFAVILVLTAINSHDVFGGCDSDGCTSGNCASGNQSMHCEICGRNCCPCEGRWRTVMVPMCVTETRMKVKIVKEMKEREKTYTVFNRVPETRTYSKECCYLETEVKSKEITKEKCRRVKNDAILEDTIRTPVVELHPGVRRHEVCTKCGKVCVEEPCTCKVIRAEEHPRVRNCKRQDVVFETCKETIDYCVKTPKMEKLECGEETVYKLVPVEKTCTEQVCVPKAIKVPCEVKVNRMVAKKIWCSDKCWCEMQEQKRKEACRAEHREKLKACASPGACCDKICEAAGKVCECPKKTVAFLCSKVKEHCKK